MSGPTEISSPNQLSRLLASSSFVVINFYNDNTPSSVAIAPIYEKLSQQLSRPSIVTFAKVNITHQSQIALSYNVTDDPTFIIFKYQKQVNRYSGLNLHELSGAIQRLTAESKNASEGSVRFDKNVSNGSAGWTGAAPPRGYGNVTGSVDARGLDLLNANSDLGGAMTLFGNSQPSALNISNVATPHAEANRDWIESDVDDQLMLYVPFTANLKIHTIHITSCVSDNDDEESPVRPKTIHLWTNRQHNLGFEEADDIPPTQTLEIQKSDWDNETATAKLELRFVKFQSVSTLVLFVADADGESGRTRIDRVRFFGEVGQMRDMSKLEKVGVED